MKVIFHEYCDPPRCDCVVSFEPSDDPVSGAIGLILVLANHLRTPVADAFRVWS